MTEPLLPFGRPSTDRLDHYTPRVLACLGDGQWHTARSLSRQIPGVNDRMLRQIAEHSKGRICGSDLGYKLVQYATVQELDTVENRLRSQARRMLRRVMDIRKARNQVMA